MLHSLLINTLIKIPPPSFTVALVGGKLFFSLFILDNVFSPGLTYITIVVRSGDHLSTWFCYFIPLQLLGNWVQFLLHTSQVPVSIDNYPGYVHSNNDTWYRTDDYYRDVDAQKQENQRQR